MRNSIASLALAALLAVSSLNLTPPAAQASDTTAPVSLLTNHSFETVTGTSGVADGWKSYAPPGATAEFQVVDSPVADGVRAQKVSASNLSAGTYADVYQEIPAEPNTQYSVLSMFWYEQLTNAGVHLYFDFYDVNGKLISGKSQLIGYAGSPRYIEKRLTILTPAGTASMRVYGLLRAISDGGAGTFYLDNVVVRKITSELYNGDFETFTEGNVLADGWERSVYYPKGIATHLIQSNNAVQGESSQQIRILDMYLGNWMTLNQTILAEANTTYNVSGQFSRLKGGPAQLYVDVYDVHGNWLKAYSVDDTDTTPGYHKLELSVTTPPDTSFLRVYAVFRGTTNERNEISYLIDDFQVNKAL